MTDANTRAAPIIRDAATVAVLRDGQDDIEVLLLRRDGGHVFGANAHVFPGGAVDTADADPVLAARCIGGGDSGLGHAPGALACAMAAIREAFEEAGVLIACANAPDAAALAAERAALNARVCRWRDVVARLDLRFALDDLRYFAYWQTPPGPPKRYATRFFAARAPAGQTASCDGYETNLAWWARPGDALGRCARGEMKLMHPTRATLEALCDYRRVEPALAGLNKTGQKPL